ncbi:MAG: hypothetical protein L3J81_01950, partial [Thermoplasmata archaeon]|nr:hypothetical protein [Thermoplasmata archaeon]
AATPDFTASCQQASGVTVPGCQHLPTVSEVNGLETLSWNFSTQPKYNVLYVGDTWSASFNVLAIGGPIATVPVDACTTTACKAGGSNAVGGFYTWAYYVPRSNTSSVYQSFPLATVNVELSGSGAPAGVGPPPFPPVPPNLPVPVAPPVPALTAVATPSTVGIANLSLNAAAAGFLGAGFVWVSMKNRPIAMQVAAMSGAKVTSKFDKAAREGSGPGMGRFE